MTNYFGTRNFMQPNEEAQGALVFFFWVLERGDLLFFGPNVFPKRHSQCHVFIYHILFGHVSISMYLSCKMGAQGKMTKHASILGRGAYLGSSSMRVQGPIS